MKCIRYYLFLGFEILFLFAFVFIIVLKNTLDMVWGVTGFIALAVVLFIAIRMYKKYRTK